MRFKTTTSDNASKPMIDGLCDLKREIPWTGLVSEASETAILWGDLLKGYDAYAYKARVPCLWLAILGGTGTGKSTLFNAVCGETLSNTGVERPKTFGPIAYAHEDCRIEDAFPFQTLKIQRIALRHDATKQTAGRPECLSMIEHSRAEWSHCVLVDTPDLDSLYLENRRTAEDLHLLSDAVVFVTSQDKYADDVPNRFLRMLVEGEKPYFFVLNKAADETSKEEIVRSFHTQGIALPESRVWLIGRAPDHPEQWIPREAGFLAFSEGLSREVQGTRGMALRERNRVSQGKALARLAERGLALLAAEEDAANKWLSQLEALCDDAAQALLNVEKDRFAARSREYLQVEIRKLFARYDVLARPRGIVKGILLTPLRFLGIVQRPDQKNELDEIFRRIEFGPILAAVEKFNKAVLETLSPPEPSAPLFKSLRNAGVLLREEDVRRLVREKHGELGSWMEMTFQQLAEEIPKGKRWGIYSTSVLWGILLITLETAVGGGFTLLDAVLDSVLAPFITKGATELFAYGEIQKAARELGKRYCEGLLSALHLQKRHYIECLWAVMPTSEHVACIRALNGSIGKHMREAEKSR